MGAILRIHNLCKCSIMGLNIPEVGLLRDEKEAYVGPGRGS